jgi:hypothetical protein
MTYLRGGLATHRVRCSRITSDTLRPSASALSRAASQSSFEMRTARSVVPLGISGDAFGEVEPTCLHVGNVVENDVVGTIFDGHAFSCAVSDLDAVALLDFGPVTGVCVHTQSVHTPQWNVKPPNARVMELRG